MYDKLKAAIIFFALIILIASNLVGCGATQKQTLQYDLVTGDNLRQTCNDPVEVHNVPPIRFPIPAMVSRHHNCMGVSDLLVVAWPLENTEVNITAANLLGLMYVEYENRTKVDTKLVITHIKNDHYEEGDMLPMKVNVAFFELKEVPLEKSE